MHFHHSLTWHGSQENASGRPRRAIALHCMNEHTLYDARGEHSMKPFISIDAGAPVSGERFPIVWSAG
jgi:phytanoyl-CoA hydroxylase